LQPGPGANESDTVSVVLGGSVRLGYFARHAMDMLNGDRTTFETLEAAFPHAGQGSLRMLAGAFGFSGDEVEKRCRVLSGGEKARLVIAVMLHDPPNFLVLDEPTNHLDIATKEMLIGALAAYEGTMLFVSHDRHFLAALSNRVLELTPGGSTNMGVGIRNTLRGRGTRRLGCMLEGGRGPKPYPPVRLGVMFPFCSALR
jgi:ATPase subunit of ABC transporter with duplicated ATPase domains